MKDLLTNRMAYVAVSRGAYDVQIFTNDREKLGAALGHNGSHSSAHVPGHKPEQSIVPSRRSSHATSRGRALKLASKTTCPGYLRRSLTARTADISSEEQSYNSVNRAMHVSGPILTVNQ